MSFTKEGRKKVLQGQAWRAGQERELLAQEKEQRIHQEKKEMSLMISSSCSSSGDLALPQCVPQGR